VPAYREPGLLNYLPQVPLLPERLTLGEAARMLGVDATKALAGFPDLIAQLSRRIGELSGGTTRLVQVLLLLHARTQFSLFDEPFSGVMPVHVETLSDLFREAKTRKGILLTDHRYAEVLPLCDVVYLLHGGRLERLPADAVPALRDRGYLAS
jgi:lipopolysaccharide export system ATP-binding protein